jgi:translocator protein
MCEAIGIVSGLLSQTEMKTWFITINKPSWNPPAYLFGPVWTILYFLMGIAMWLIWKSDKIESKKTNALLLFALQLFLNFWWSILFFKFHLPGLAFVDIILMVIIIIITIFRFAPISRLAAWLLVPYISWVCFASILNYTIWILNK